MNGRFIIFSLVCLVAGISHGNSDFSRYQVILDRMPFGSEPTPESIAAANAKPLPPQELFTRNLKMCAVTRNLVSGDLQVGLIDAVTKKNYFLRVGESEDGITVLEADYDGERALLKKDTQEVWLGMNDAVAMTRAPVAAAPAQVVKVTGGSLRSSRGNSSPRVLHPERLKPTLTGEALQNHLEQYQMDLIRAGGEKGPPLPMELTPEMDKQLVAEGVLPPQ